MTLRYKLHNAKMDAAEEPFEFRGLKFNRGSFIIRGVSANELRPVVADLGHFLMTKQWYENPSDPFKRSPSVITYDRETDRLVDQDNRVWVAGLGDEGGSGSWVAAAMESSLTWRAL